MLIVKNISSLNYSTIAEILHSCIPVAMDSLLSTYSFAIYLVRLIFEEQLMLLIEQGNRYVNFCFPQDSLQKHE